MVNGLATSLFFADLTCGSPSLALLHHLRCSDLPGHRHHDAQNAENASPDALREGSDSCYKQEHRANSADARQHEESDDGEQHRNDGNQGPTQSIHRDLRAGHPERTWQATMAANLVIVILKNPNFD
jgi:hypothetical protein